MPSPDSIASEHPLAGRRIALVEHRELDRLGRMLEEQGAETLRCPLLAIADAPDQAMVRAWIERAIAAPIAIAALTQTTPGRPAINAAANAIATETEMVPAP